MTFFPDVRGSQCIVFHGLIHCKAGRNREKQMFFTEEAFAVNSRIHAAVINQKIQGA